MRVRKRTRPTLAMDKGRSSHCNGDMHCGRFLQSVQVPPLLAHRVTNFQNVDSRTLLCPESDNGHRRVTKDVKFWDLSFDTVDNLPSGGDDLLS
jgi:hypothetical protein